MKKFLMLVIIVLLSLTFFANTTAAYADINLGNAAERTIRNEMVQKSNKNIESKTLLTHDDMVDIARFSEIKYENISGNKVVITIQNNVPEKTIYYDDGSMVQEYTTSIVSGEYDETYKTVDVEIFVKMTYSAHKHNNLYKFSRLNYGYGKLVNCRENGYRNLKIKNTVWGDYQNPDGSSGETKSITNSTTIASPTKGVLYSLSSPGSNYYGTGVGSGAISVEVSIEWQHGSWYTTSWSISRKIIW